MRIYQSAYEILSEAFRDLHEMGIITRPKTYQNKVIEGKDEMITKEIVMYSYALLGLPDPDNLFIFEGPNARTWADAEFKERVDPTSGNPGEAWEIRKDVWEEFLTPDGRMDYTYSERLNDYTGLDQAITLLRKDPDTRQAWIPIFWPEDLTVAGGKNRIPCSLGYQLLLRDGKLNLIYIQRSADAVKHWGNDIYLAHRMMKYAAGLLRVGEGTLYHTITSLHSYKRDWPTLENGISKLVKYNG